MKIVNTLVGLLVGMSLMACSGHKFDLGMDEDNFSQNSKVTSVPIDILWVIDDSGSMETSQNQVANNIAAFIKKFKATNFDFHIAVTTTGAYRSLPLFGGNQSYSRFVDGTDATGHTGYYVMDRHTPNLEQVFQVNVKQGILGSADERSLQAMEAALLNPVNALEFPRVGAFLAVIFLTDEEDFSWNGTANIQLLSNGTPNSVNDSRLLAPSSFLSVLDTVTNSTATKRNYSVNTIAILSEACRVQLSTSFTGRRISTRLAELSDITGGVKADLCEDFSGVLSNITDSILEFTTKFYLNRAADPETLEIYVEDKLIPREGWTYNSNDNSVTFHGDHIPGQSANIRVRFQPTTVK